VLGIETALCGGAWWRKDRQHRSMTGYRCCNIPTDDTILSTPGDECRVLKNKPGGGFQVISTDHLRAPLTMIRLKWHDRCKSTLWAHLGHGGAARKQPCSTSILPICHRRYSPRQRLVKVTRAANDVFLSCLGARPIVGGHTTMAPNDHRLYR